MTVNTLSVMTNASDKNYGKMFFKQIRLLPTDCSILQIA